MSSFFAAALADIGSELKVIGRDIKVDFQEIETEAVADIDALLGQLVPFATKGAAEVEAAVADGSIMQSEKRSALTVKVGSQAQALGYSLKQQGIAAVINLAVEFGVNFLKLIVGNAVGAPANKPAG